MMIIALSNFNLKCNCNFHKKQIKNLLISTSLKFILKLQLQLQLKSLDFIKRQSAGIYPTFFSGSGANIDPRLIFYCIIDVDFLSKRSP